MPRQKVLRWSSPWIVTAIIGALAFTTACQPSSPSSPSSTPKASAALPASHRAVFLGESYSSGEGAPAIVDGKPQYKSGSDQTDNRCHRSTVAYGPLFGKTLDSSYRTGFYACSGALVKDFYSSFKDNHNGANPAEIPQLDQLTKDTDIVTLTIGGNDVGFGQIMTDCIARDPRDPSCETVDGSSVNETIAQIRDSHSLENLYREIKKRVADGAKIYVLGYPRFFPSQPPRTCDSGAVTQFQASDMLWINSSIKSFDDLIKSESGKAGVTYVEASYELLNGHELCTSQPWLNRYIMSLTDKSVIKGSFHPNRDGQLAYLAALLGELRTKPSAQSFARYAGSWGGHGRSVTIDASGHGEVTYRTYNWCTGVIPGDVSDPSRPCESPNSYDAGHASFQIDRVASSDGDTVHATLLSTNDPSKWGSEITITWLHNAAPDGVTVQLDSSPPGEGPWTFCDDAAQMKNACGA